MFSYRTLEQRIPDQNPQPWEKDDPGPVRIGEFEQSSASRRIVLRWDNRQFEPMPRLNRFSDAFGDGGVFVLPIYWGPGYKRWTVAPVFP